MKLKFGFCGMGNMASAIVGGALKVGALVPEQIVGYDPWSTRLQEFAREGVGVAASPAALAESCDIVVLAVKPKVVEQVVAEMGDALIGKAVLSIALGWRYAELSGVLPESVRRQAVMPNIPMQVCEGVCLLEEQNSLTDAEHAAVTALFSAIGTVTVLPTALMKSAGSLSGCGPAFTYMYIEALADAAVYHGVPRADAYRLAAQTVLGAAKTVLETGVHPGALKDSVCSPGGSTIRGVAKLEELGFRSAVIETIREVERY